MRRWNGWGDTAITAELNEHARAFLNERVGPSTPGYEAPRERVLASIAEPRIRLTAGWRQDAASRLDHARGQSLPDWIALKSGRIGPVADAVAAPDSAEGLEQALKQALAAGAVVIPYGGGTSVVGHLQVPVTDRPVVNLSLANYGRLLDYEPRTQLARFGAGVAGPQVEAQLKPHGVLLGHFPQSYEYSTLGGWVVTRSSGQQSYRYGRIEDLFHGGTLLTPRGRLEVGGWPASSAGPDLRHCVLGSEGRLGLLSEVSVRVRPRAPEERFHAVFFPGWEQGLSAVRRMVQAGLPLSMLRLSNAVETETQLRLSGHDKLVAWLQRYLGLRGIGAGQCMLLIGLTGTLASCRRLQREALALAKPDKGVHVGKAIGQGWAKNRFQGPYLRNALWAAGYAVDTVETCVDWTRATAMMQAIEGAAERSLAQEGERGHVFTHLSHVYRQGCSIYTTMVFRLTGDPDADLERWRRLKTAISEAIVAQRGTISHQHGVGVDHAPYLEAEKGPLGLELIRSMMQTLDPEGRMNPGKLLP